MLIKTQLYNLNATKQTLAAQNSKVSFKAKKTLLSSCLLIATSILALSITGCGQKGDLYIAAASSQTVNNSSQVLTSTSNPQDAAFAGLNNADYQSNLDVERLMTDVSDDPNDY